MSVPVRAEPVVAEPVAAAPVERTSSTSSSSAGSTSLLAREAEEGVQILDRLSDVCKAQFQCPPMSPSYVSEAKAVILLRGTKAGKQPLGRAGVQGSGRADVPAHLPLAASCCLAGSCAPHAQRPCCPPLTSANFVLLQGWGWGSAPGTACCWPACRRRRQATRPAGPPPSS